MSIELKIKSKHLSQEAQIIRFEERKLKVQAAWLRRSQAKPNKVEYTLNSISLHRRWDVRNEQRATFLARAYIKGLPYKAVETRADPNKLYIYILPRVVAMLSKYHNNKVTKEDVLHWINGTSLKDTPS